MKHFGTYLQISLKSSWRNLKRNLGFNLLNLSGLALTSATLLLLFCYLYHEQSYEQFHANRDRIYRPIYQTSTGDFSVQWARIPVDYINALPDEIPGIDHLIRFQNQEQKYIRVDDKRFKPKHAYITDAEVFDVFTFPFLAGDSGTALKKPHSVVLTKAQALTMFSQTDVIGQEIFVSGDWSPEEQPFTITGIIEDIPTNTHLPADMFFSFANEKERSGWAYVYIELKPETSIQHIEEKMADFIRAHRDNPAGSTVNISFQPLEDIHLESHLAREIKPNGQRIYLKIFFWFGLFIWIISIVNFSNINLAFTFNRGKEIGVRKILGAHRRHIAWQMFGEALFYCGAGTLLGIILAQLTFPLLQQISDIDHAPPLSYVVTFLLGFILISSTLSAILPILLVSSINIIQALKNKPGNGIQKNNIKINIRKSLIAVQFFAALLLIIGTLITYSQLRFIRQKNLGLSSQQVLAIPSVPENVTRGYFSFKDQLEALPNVESVAACMQVPSDEIRDTGPVMIKGKGMDPNLAPQIDIQVVDPEFTNLMQLQILAGHSFDQNSDSRVLPQFTTSFTPEEYLRNAPREYVINESALHQLGWQNPNDAIGQEINFSIGGFELNYGPIIGVINDYHQESLRNKVDPLIMVVEPLWYQTFLIKLKPDHLQESMASLDKIWNQMFPYHLEVHFLDDLFDKLYYQDKTQIKLLAILSALAIVNSLIGLIGLLAYSLHRRTKEFAIRRVAGASLRDLTGLVGKEYLFILLLATIIAIPATLFWGMKWLENFAYHADLTPALFLLPAIILAIPLITIIVWLTHRATNKNPIHFLRDE